MGLFDKIGKGLKKLGSFAGKVLKGVASGGVVGGIAAGVSNLGGGSSAQKATFASSTATLGNTNPTINAGGATTSTMTQQQLWTRIGIVAGAVALLFVVINFFRRKRR
jgi:hypothetical protein